MNIIETRAEARGNNIIAPTFSYYFSNAISLGLRLCTRVEPKGMHVEVNANAAIKFNPLE